MWFALLPHLHLLWQLVGIIMSAYSIYNIYSQVLIVKLFFHKWATPPPTYHVITVWDDKQERVFRRWFYNNFCYGTNSCYDTVAQEHLDKCEAEVIKLITYTDKLSTLHKHSNLVIIGWQGCSYLIPITWLLDRLKILHHLKVVSKFQTNPVSVHGWICLW